MGSTIKKNNFPKHIAIIMDGNGRWAKQRGLPRSLGHRAGVKTVKRIVKACSQIGIHFVTLYAFSRENWKRPKQEVSTLMRLLEHFLEKEVSALHQNNVKFLTIGRHQGLPAFVQKKIDEAVHLTRKNTGLTLILALNYGGRQEIIDAVNKIIASRHPRQIDESSFSRYLYTSGIPDPDLLIRTSGEMRVSNFLLWQISYSELYITPKLWPDFTKKDLEAAIKEYQRRERRFGN